jgi:hypothetical protein
MRTARLSVLVATCGLAGLALTACGGTQAPGSSPSAAGSGTAASDQLVAFARCMRAHGVNVPDPKPGDGLAKLIGPARKGNKAAFQRGVNACKDKLPKSATTRTPSADAMLRWAQCMRAHGVNVPDPKAGQQRPDLSQVDQSSPRFAAATDACSKYLRSEGSS